MPLGSDASQLPPMASGSRPRRMILGIRFPDSSGRAPGSRRSSQPLCPSLAQSLQVLLHLRMAFLSAPFQFGFLANLTATYTARAKVWPPTTAHSPGTPPVASRPDPKEGPGRQQPPLRLPGRERSWPNGRALRPSIARDYLARPWLGQAHHAVALAPAGERSDAAWTGPIKCWHSYHLLASLPCC